MTVEPPTDVPRGVLPPTFDPATLTRRQRAQLKRSMRWQRRIDRYEARRAGPPPPRHLHRAVVMIIMLVMMLGLLALMVTAPAPAPPA